MRDLDGAWREDFEAASTAVAQWRREHPRATLTEIEDALDERLHAVRGRMLEEMVLVSGAAVFAGAEEGERPRCPGCGDCLVSLGVAERRLMTTGGREVRLRRAYGRCPSCGTELFPPR